VISGAAWKLGSIPNADSLRVLGDPARKLIGGQRDAAISAVIAFLQLRSKRPTTMGGPFQLALAARDRFIGPRAGAMTRGMTLGARVVRPLAAVAGTEVRIGEDRRRRDGQSPGGEGESQHLPTHGKPPWR